MKLEFIKQKLEIDFSFGFTINQYSIVGKFDLNELLKINQVFDHEIRPSHINKDKSGYLKGLFKTEMLSVKDFKFINTNGIYYYLEGFSESVEEWGDQRFFFKNLIDKFKINCANNMCDCYLINKEWFYDNKEKVNEREFALYDFYFIVLWIDKKDSSKLYISEWFAD